MTAQIQQLLARATKDELDRVTLEELLAPDPVVSRDDARLLKAALYLKHGHLDACHKIAQQIATPTASYWHGILHRREGDIGNSHYWYDRVGNHPVLAAIGGYPRDAATEQREFDLLLAHTLAAARGQ